MEKEVGGGVGWKGGRRGRGGMWEELGKRRGEVIGGVIWHLRVWANV